MQKKPILYILIEIKARELEGRTLLALEAASRGFRVVIGNKGQILAALHTNLFPTGICFEKSLSAGKEAKIAKLMRDSFVVVSQDEETGLAQDNYSSFVSIRSSRQNVEMADAIFCFGKIDYSIWTKKYSNLDHKIFLTGSPRFDFWRSDYYYYFQNSIDILKQRFNKYILLSSNFGIANGYMSIEKLLYQGKKNGSICSREDEHAMLALIEDTKIMFRSFVKLVDYLSKKFSDYNFIVRPHPSEKISGWKQLLPKRDNIKVIFEGNIRPWVLAASAILHNGCTTGIEAYASGVPAIAYIPFKSPVNRIIPNRLSIQCTKKEDVAILINKIKQGEYINEQINHYNDKFIRDRIINMNGETAAKRIVDVLEKIECKKNQFPKIKLIDKIVGEKNRIKRFLDVKRGTENKSTRKFPGLKLNDLKKIQKNLIEANSSYSECKIKHLYGDLFVIEKS